MKQRSISILSIWCAAICATLVLHLGAGRASIQNVIRELMPPEAKCKNAEWEPLFYCRFATPQTVDVVFELSFGQGGSGGSLTYNAGSIEGHRFLDAMKVYFSLGVSKPKIDQCISASRLQSAEIVVRDKIVRCRY